MKLTNINAATMIELLETGQLQMKIDNKGMLRINVDGLTAEELTMRVSNLSPEDGTTDEIFDDRVLSLLEAQFEQIVSEATKLALKWAKFDLKNNLENS